MSFTSLDLRAAARAVHKLITHPVMLHDATSAVRSLLRRPATTITAVLTLAIGLGAATAIFSVVYTLLVRPLAYPDSERLVRVWELTPERERFSASGPDYLDFQRSTRTFDALGAFASMPRSMTLADGAEATRIAAMPVTAGFFDVLRVAPVLGRVFTPEEDRAGADAHRIVLGHAVWRSRFGSDPSVVDRVVTLDRQPFVIVGVMPPGFDFPFASEAWVPAAPDSAAMTEGKALEMIGRLAAGVTIDQARADLQAAAQVTAARDPDANAGWTADAAPLREWLVTSDFRDALLVLFGAVGCLVLLACANVANLLLAQASRRQAEMRLRVALGASRAQLVRLMFAESALLAALGTAAGLLLAMWILAGLRVVSGGRIPRLDEVALHPPVLLFAVALTILVCAIFGTAPALHASRHDLRASLDAGFRVTRRGHRTRGLIVSAEVALAVILLTGAGLLAISFTRLAAVHPGFETAGLVSVPIELPSPQYDETAGEFYASLVDRVASIPGVDAVGATTTDPFRQSGFVNSVTPEEAVAFAPPSGLVQAGWRAVTPDYFEAAGVPLIAGRAFTGADRDDTTRVAIVSAGLAARLWPDGSAVGRRILWGGLTGRPRLVVGVAGDIRDFALDAAATPMLFLPHAQVPIPSMTLLVRASRPGALGPAIRAEVRRMDAALPAPDVTRVDDNRTRAFAGPRFNALLVGAFAAVAMLLAVSGVYALLAFTIGERRREIAVRLALGARPSTILRMIVGEGLRLTLAGLAAGLLAAAWLTRYLTSLLFDVRASDPATFAAVAATLTVFVLAASLVPAQRAARMNPLEGLRSA